MCGLLAQEASPSPVYGAALLMRFGFTAHPGFKSPSLRPLKAGPDPSGQFDAAGAMDQGAAKARAPRRRLPCRAVPTRGVSRLARPLDDHKNTSRNPSEHAGTLFR
jgi:hypothetical protein